MKGLSNGFGTIADHYRRRLEGEKGNLNYSGGRREREKDGFRFENLTGERLVIEALEISARIPSNQESPTKTNDCRRIEKQKAAGVYSSARLDCETALASTII